MSLKLFRGPIGSLPGSLAEGEIAWTTDTQQLFVGSASEGNVLINDSAAGSGDVSGPPSSYDNGVAVFDNTTGKVLASPNVLYTDIILNSDHRVIVAGNPHRVSFTDSVAEDPGTDVTAAEMETLTDGSAADGLHNHTITTTPAFDYIDLYPIVFGPPAREEGRLFYDPDELCLVLYPGGAEVTQQIGHELLVKAENLSGFDINNGEVVSLSSAGYIEKAISSDPSSALVTIGAATELIENGTAGLVTSYGTINDVDTSAWPMSTVLYLSDTVAGALVSEPPVSPSHVVRVGVVTNQDAVTGSIFVKVSNEGNIQGMNKFYNGSCIEDINETISSDGSTVTFTYDTFSGRQQQLIFDEDLVEFPVPASVPLVPGSDTVPVKNFVFIPRSTNALTVSTAGFPVNEQYTPVATIVCQSAASVATDTVYRHQQWKNNIADTDNQGHLPHINEWIRSQHATWLTGGATTVTINTGTAPDEVYADISAGTARLLHVNGFSPVTMTTGDHLLVSNGATIPYEKIYDIADVLEDANGDSLENRRFSLVLMLVVNSTGESTLLMTVPNGSYGNDSDAIDDPEGHAVYSVPQEFRGGSLLLSRLVFRQRTIGGGTHELLANLDLRGNTMGSSDGGSSSGSSTSVFTDEAFKVVNAEDALKVITFDAGSLLTTRVFTYPDSDGTIALTADLQDPHANRAILDATTESFLVSDKTDIGLNSAHRVMVTGNPHNLDKADVGLNNVTNDQQMKDIANGITGSSAVETTAPLTSSIVWVEAAAGSLRWSTLWNLPISGYTQAALDNKEDSLTFDLVPIDGSTNPVQSNGIFDGLVLKSDVGHTHVPSEVGLGNVTNDRQVRNVAYSWVFDFPSVIASTHHLALLQSPDGVLEYCSLQEFPISNRTQAALDDKGSGTKRAMIELRSPVAGEFYQIFMAPVPCTIQQVTAQSSDNTITYDMEIRDNGQPTSTGTSVFSSERLAWSGYTVETTFINDSLNAEQWLTLLVNSSPTPPVSVYITVEYTED